MNYSVEGHGRTPLTMDPTIMSVKLPLVHRRVALDRS